MGWRGISFDDQAQAAAERLSRQQINLGKPLRLWLEGKGCDGFYYGIAFDEVRQGDIHFVAGEVTLLVDKETIEYVDGSSITWVDDERGRGFLVNNPSHRKYRGKFYKRKKWQMRQMEKQEKKFAAVSGSGAEDPR